jgi:hypothetical protein
MALGVYLPVTLAAFLIAKKLNSAINRLAHAFHQRLVSLVSSARLEREEGRHAENGSHEKRAPGHPLTSTKM